MAKEKVDRDLGEVPTHGRRDEVSLLAVANVLLRSRRTLAILAGVGGLIGVLVATLSPRVYSANAKFIPGGTESTPSGLALAASQFGITLPNSNGAWGPSVYAELLRSRSLLEPIALDTVVVAEDGGKRETVLSLLGVDPQPTPRNTDIGVRKLSEHVEAAVVPELGAVSLTVTTKWPSVSLALAQKLVRGVGTFNLERRRSQAAAERQFVDAQAAESEHALRDAENALQEFLQRNREYSGSPQLAFDRDRLQRQVSLQQQIYTSLLQNREEARIREVRDTPVITVLEDPRLPVIGEPRNVVLKTLLGAIAGFLIGAVIALFRFGLSATERDRNAEAREFVRLLGGVVPRMRRRKESTQATVSR